MHPSAKNQVTLPKPKARFPRDWPKTSRNIPREVRRIFISDQISTRVRPVLFFDPSRSESEPGQLL